MEVSPESVDTASLNVNASGQRLEWAHSGAGAATMSALPPASDAVSQMSVATLLLRSQQIHATIRSALAEHQSIVSRLASSATGYASSESVNASSVG